MLLLLEQNLVAAAQQQCRRGDLSPRFFASCAVSALTIPLGRLIDTEKVEENRKAKEIVTNFEFGFCNSLDQKPMLFTGLVHERPKKADQ